MSDRADLYAGKDRAYFAGARRDIIDRLTASQDRAILEIGCGEGATAAYAKAAKKCGLYVGVELSAPVAAKATAVLDEVHVGNVEEMELPFRKAMFDVLIASEVLEHLVDPWAVLRKLHPYLKPDALVFASSPNVAHKSTLAMLLRGRWDLAHAGAMDRTHLRWFTPQTYRAMFEECGFDVVSVGPLAPPSASVNVFNALTGQSLSHLLMRQISITARVRGDHPAG